MSPRDTPQPIPCVRCGLPAMRRVEPPRAAVLGPKDRNSPQARWYCTDCFAKRRGPIEPTPMQKLLEAEAAKRDAANTLASLIRMMAEDTENVDTPDT